MQLLQYLGGREQTGERVFDSHGKYTQMAEEEGVEPSITASKAACVTVRISPYRTHARRSVHSTYTIYVEPQSRVELDSPGYKAGASPLMLQGRYKILRLYQLHRHSTFPPFHEEPKVLGSCDCDIVSQADITYRQMIFRNRKCALFLQPHAIFLGTVVADEGRLFIRNSVWCHGYLVVSVKSLRSFAYRK